MTVNLKLNKSLFVPKFYPLLFDYTHRWEIYNGSAGSAKSYFITQKLLIRAINEPIRILVCRRYGTTIRNTCFSLFKDIIKKWHLMQYVKIRETDFTISFDNGSEIIFSGLDEETKLLSLNNIGCIFVEEAYEVPRDLVEQLNLRLRGKTANQQILMAFNPISKDSWLYDFCNNLPESALYIHSTYKDNPFLSADYVNALEEMKTRNPKKAKVFVYGEWGVNSDELVYTNWRVEEFDEMAISEGLELRNGLDFGFVDPTAFVCSLYDAKNHVIYVYDEWYKAGSQLNEVVDAINRKHQKKTLVWCDSAEPRSIEFLRNNGLSAKPCIKGADSVNARIAFLQNNTIIVKPSCENVIRELENFRYIKNKDGILTDKTTHEYSHTLDALGYAYSDIYRGGKLRSANKTILGL